MANDTYDQFFARIELAETVRFLRHASTHPAARRLERAVVDFSQRGEERVTLAWFARARMRETFVATVAGRGFSGKMRTVMVRDLRLFSSKFILEDHLWVRYDKLWTRMEPFLQGQQVVLFGTAIEYTRKNQTCDYTLALENVTKL